MVEFVQRMEAGPTWDTFIYGMPKVEWRWERERMLGNIGSTSRG
jgi:hypothetical protein